MDINSLIQSLLADKGAEFARSLASSLGIDPALAESFVPLAIDKLGGALGSGDFDLASILAGSDLSSLVAKADPAGIASQLGMDTSQATQGLTQLAPQLLDALKTEGAGDLLDSLGGAGGLAAAAGKLGSLFKA